MVMRASVCADTSPTGTPLLPWWGTLALLTGLAGAGFRSLARKPAFGLVLFSALAVGAQAHQDTIVYRPANASIVSYREPSSLDIDINGDGVVDFTLTNNPSGGCFPSFRIVPAGQNAVLSDSTNWYAWAWYLPTGATVGPQGSAAGSVWLTNLSPIITEWDACGGLSEPGSFPTQGYFVFTNGSIGVRFTVGTNETHYGFLWLDCRAYSPGYGGLYLGCAWNTAPSQPVTTWPQPAPISFKPLVGTMLLSWPTPDTNCVLQTATTLQSGGNWTTITNGVFSFPPAAGIDINGMQYMGGTSYYYYGLTNRPNNAAFFRLVPR